MLLRVARGRDQFQGILVGDVGEVRVAVGKEGGGEMPLAGRGGGGREGGCHAMDILGWRIVKKGIFQQRLLSSTRWMNISQSPRSFTKEQAGRSI